MRYRRFLSILLTLVALLTAVAAGHQPSSAAASPWRLAYETRFPVDVPLGHFAGCGGGWATTTCIYLPSAYKADWWAYPYPWPDTATQRNYPVGGYYAPYRTVWVSGGQLHLRMFREGSGPVMSAALVPKAAINQTYGRYTETWQVSHIATGYKSAHLLWPHNSGDFETDYPENEWDTSVCVYVHADGPQQGFCPGTTWGGWHTTVIEWSPGRLVFQMDGRVIGQTSNGVPNVPMDWIVQNESALDGEHAAPNSWAQMNISYVRVDHWAG